MRLPPFSAPEGAPEPSQDGSAPPHTRPVWPPGSHTPPAGGQPRGWLPQRWQQPLVGYVAAVLLELLATLCTWLLSQALSSFGFPGALTLLVVAFVALVWGAGPSLLATLLGVALIDYVLLPPSLTWYVNVSDLIGLSVFLLVGLVTSRLASRHKQVRDAAETLAVTLEQERARLQAILEAIPDPITFYDAQGTLVAANHAGWQSIGGRPLPAALETLPQASYMRTVQGDPLPAEQLPVARALRGELVNGVEVVSPAGDGHDRILLSGAAPIRNGQGQIEGAVAISHDVTERLRLEREVVERAQEFEAIFEAMTDGVFVFDAKGDIRRVNAFARDILGPEVSKWQGRPMEERFAYLVPRDLDAQVMPFERLPAQRVLRGEVLTGAEAVDLLYLTADGRTLVTSFSGKPLRDQAGVITGAVLVAHDVSARWHLEREVAQRASELEALFEAVTESIYVFSPDMQLLRSNAVGRSYAPVVCDPVYFSHPLAERLSRQPVVTADGQVVPLEDWPASRALRGEIVRGASAPDLLVERQGEPRIVNVSAAPVRDTAGAISGAVLVTHDVTERRQLERRTQASLEAVLAIAEALVTTEPEPAEAPPAFTAAAPALRVLSLACQVLGCANATFVSREPDTDGAHLVACVGFIPEQEERVRTRVEGTRFADHYPDPRLLARLHAGEVQVLDLEQSPFQDQQPLTSLLQALLVPLRLGETLIGVISLHQEEPGHPYTQADRALAQGMGRLAGLILERERLFREREEARANVLALSETTRQMDAFLSIVSHELRTPVTSIKGSVQLLLKREGGLAPTTVSPEDNTVGWSSQQRSLRRIERQIARLTRLLDDLIDLARIRSGKLEVQVEACDLGELVDEVVEEERLAHPDRLITLVLPTGAPVRVLADADRTGQVLTNYLTNALKYSPSEEPVEVGLTLEEGQARVWVRDHGPGIPLEDQAHLWNLFYRVPGIEVQSGSGIGLGLGLYISKTMMERQGGQVGVESHPGAGSTFWMALPCETQ